MPVSTNLVMNQNLKIAAASIWILFVFVMYHLSYLEKVLRMLRRVF